MQDSSVRRVLTRKLWYNFTDLKYGLLLRRLMHATVS